MFYYYDDNKFKKIIDKFILSSANNKQLSCDIRNIDQQAAKLGIFFYQMMFLVISKWFNWEYEKEIVN